MCSSFSFSGSGIADVHSNADATHETARGEEEDRDREAAQRRGDGEGGAEAAMLADRADGERADADAGVERPDRAAERAAAVLFIGRADEQRHERGKRSAHADAEE